MEKIFRMVKEQEGKKITLKNERELYYVKFTNDDEKKGIRKEIIEKSIGYVILEDLKKEDTVYDQPEVVRKQAVDILMFFGKKYVLWKHGIDKSKDSDWDTEYLVTDDDGICHIKDSYIKGYFHVRNNETKTQNIVLLVSKKKFPLILLLLLLLVFFAMCARAFYHPEKQTGPTSQSSTIEFSEDAIDYDDRPVMTDETNDETGDGNGDIDLNVFTDQTLNAGDTIPFTNYSSNIDNLEFFVTLAGSTDVIYDTGVIAPGKQVPWDISKTLEAGEYSFDIYLSVYPEDGSEASYLCFQRNFNVVLK